MVLEGLGAPNLCLLEKKTFMNAFLIYVLPSSNVKPHPLEIPSQYQEFKDVFKKKNVGTLPKH